MLDEVKAFNLDDVQIHLQGSYTTLIPHNAHAGQDGYDLTKLFDNDTVTPSYVWWDAKSSGPYPIAINSGDQLLSVTIPSVADDTLRDRQVKYFKITWEQQKRFARFIILRNGEVVYDDGPTIDGYGSVRYTRRYDLPLPDFLQEPPDPPPPLTPPPPPGPPPPPLIPTIPTLHWDYETFYDNQNAVLFENYSGADIVDGKAVINTSNAYLLASIPSTLVSKFSISLIFNFKSLNSGDPINFIFTTYKNFSQRREGIMLRLIDGNIEFELHGKNSPPDYLSNTLYSIYEPITGFPGVLFDEFCNLAITFDYNTNIIKTYINGSLNSSTNALVSGVNIKDLQLGTNYGGNENVTFYMNKWVDSSHGLHESDDFKFFNSILTQ
jgi:hypothetical protein